MKHSGRIEADDGVQGVWVSYRWMIFSITPNHSYSCMLFWTSQLIVLTIDLPSWQDQRNFGQGVDGKLARWPNTWRETVGHPSLDWFTVRKILQKTIVFACVCMCLPQPGLRAEEIPETHFWSLRSHLSDAGARNQQLASCASPCQSWEPLERSGTISP